MCAIFNNTQLTLGKSEDTEGKKLLNNSQKVFQLKNWGHNQVMRLSIDKYDILVNFAKRGEKEKS